MLRKLMLIVNPHSGRGLSKTALGSVVAKLGKNGFAVTVYIAQIYNPQQLAFEFAKHYELIVCIGGDGTLSGVVSGLLSAGISGPVGYIPSGTSNDVARALELPKDPATAAQKIIDGSPIPLDIGNFYGEDGAHSYFTYIAAFGAFTDVPYTTPQNLKRSLGHFAYVLSGFARVAAITAHHTVVHLDDNVIEGDFIFGGVVNSTSVAGFLKINPVNVDLADGVFEVILVKQPLGLTAFLDILTNIANRSYSGDAVTMHRAKNVKFSFKTEVTWTIDGEDGGLHSNVVIENSHEAIRIIV